MVVVVTTVVVVGSVVVVVGGTSASYKYSLYLHILTLATVDCRHQTPYSSDSTKCLICFAQIELLVLTYLCTNWRLDRRRNMTGSRTRSRMFLDPLVYSQLYCCSMVLLGTLSIYMSCTKINKSMNSFTSCNSICSNQFRLQLQL